MTATYEIPEMREQAIKAGRYFATGMRRHSTDFVAYRMDGVVIVIACDKAGEMLTNLVNTERIGRIVNGVEDVAAQPPAETQTRGAEQEEEGAPVEQAVVLVPIFHAPPPEHANKPGHFHLHVLNHVKLGRRVRLSGECLCSKKHGSNEQTTVPPEATACAECARVAQENGLRWSR